MFSMFKSKESSQQMEGQQPMMNQEQQSMMNQRQQPIKNQGQQMQSKKTLKDKLSKIS